MKMASDAVAVTFRLVDFNERRYRRGADAARVEVLEDGESAGWLWMSPKDLRANIREFGECEELRKALAEYEKAKG